jgi:CRP-like cAMP-binding protein
MNEKEIISALQKVPIFAGLNQRQLQSVAKLSYERQYKAGEVIVKQGEQGIGMFLIVAGKAEAVRERADGSKATVNTFAAGDFFGELALLDDGVRTASVVTTEDSECLGLPRWDFQTLLKNDAEMTLSILLEVARRFRVMLDSM